MLLKACPSLYFQLLKKTQKTIFKKLQGLVVEKLLRKGQYGLFTKAEYQHVLSDWYLSNALVGRDSSNYFHQEARWNVKHAKFSSPVASWTEKELHKEFLGPLWSMKMKEVNDHALRECIVLRKYLAFTISSSSSKRTL